MAFGSTEYSGNAYKYGTQFPPLFCEGDSVWVTLNETLSAAFVADDEAQLGLIKNIPADVFPVEVHLESSDVDTHATPTFDADLCAILNDDSEVIIVNSIIPAGGAATSTSYSVDNTAADFTTGDDLEDLVEALQVSSANVPYDLALIIEAAAATAAAGTLKLRVKFMRDVRDLGTVWNSTIADGQA